MIDGDSNARFHEVHYDEAEFKTSCVACSWMEKDKTGLPLEYFIIQMHRDDSCGANDLERLAENRLFNDGDDNVQR